MIKLFGFGEKFSQKIEPFNILLNALASPLTPPTYFIKAQRFKKFHPWFERHFGFVSGVFLKRMDLIILADFVDIQWKITCLKAEPSTIGRVWSSSARRCDEFPLTIIDLDHLQIPWIGSRGCLPRNANAPGSRARFFNKSPTMPAGCPWVSRGSTPRYGR